MSKLLDKMLEHTGLTEVPQYSQQRGVSYSSEFRRIESLPRRNWEELDLKFIEKCIYEELRMKGSTASLWPVQIASIYEATVYGGAFLPIGVGRGKAYISLLVAQAMEAERPLLVVPAQLRDQTKKEVIPKMQGDWKLHPNLTIIGYEELGLAKNVDFLNILEPDLMIFDECQYLKNPKAGRTKRVNRWFREHPETKCVAESGTISKGSVKDFAHIIYWCLKGMAPIPLNWSDIMNWCDALDTNVPEEERMAPGALNRFCDLGENVRQGFRRRLTETPGVVTTKNDDLGVSLRIVSNKIEVPKELTKKINWVRNNWENLDGDIIREASTLLTICREMNLGFYYRWDPPAPREWMYARCEWNRYVRETLKHNRRNLDTELQVWNECKNKFPDMLIWNDWKDVKDSFKIKTVPVWIDDFALLECKKWMDSCTTKNPGIVWTEFPAFGIRLAELSGFPYFGGGDDAIRECTDTAMIASIAAHGQGKNLQAFSRNLVTTPPSSGHKWEQLLGRTHRVLQEADTVICEVFLYCDIFQNSFDKALRSAPGLEHTYGRQKLNYADIVLDF